MRLAELTVHGFRGFPPEDQTLEFGGRSAVILGDNGTGKSSVLAAVEFLLTGGMTHLSGPGTGSIDIPTHAPHQWADPEECYVRGTFEADNGNRGTVERRADDHTTLETVEGDIDSDEISVSQWNDEHLILTRGQLLEFIESPPGSRGERLSKLLNLSGITNRARGFDRIKSKLEDRADRKRSTCDRQVEDIDAVTELEIEFPISDESEVSLLETINEKFSALGAEELEGMDELSNILESVELLVAEEALDPFYESRTSDRLGDVKDWAADNQEQIQEDLDSLAGDLAELDAADESSLFELDLFETATDLITPDTTECPLCGEGHEQDYLNDRVESQRERLTDLRELREQITDQKRDMLQDLRTQDDELQEVLELLHSGLEAGDHVQVSEDVERLDDYSSELSGLIEVLSQDLVREPEEGTIDIVQINPDELTPNWESMITACEEVIEYIASLEPLEERSQTHSDLVTIDNAWDTLQEEESELQRIEVLVDNMDQVQELFTEAREEVLEELYLDIEDSFNDFYTTIHPDEQEIDLDFNAEGTESVELEATFEEERDSPLAFHSEGHIDTMGICLFLALRDRLNMDGPNVVMLDDIVMSVDKTHRNGVARLLYQYLDEGPQGILATHDEVWSDQLTDADVVTRNSVLEITDWDISTGPMLHSGSWEVIEDYLDENRPHAAAAHLRRQAEKLGRTAAQRLKPPLEYKERYSLADFIYGISGQVKTVATGAKRQYEDHSDEWESAQDLDNQRSELLGDFGLDELNGMVHYRRDEWGQLDAEDLWPVLEHWREIEGFLHCDENQDMIYYEESGDWRWIQCDCRHVQVGCEFS